MRKSTHYLYMWPLAIAILLSSCSKVINPYLSHYKTAQEAFNQASSAENSLKSNPNAVFSLAPETNYRTARSFMIKAMGEGQEQENKSALAADGLLLGAYTIKAMSEWKLELYSEALNTAKNCQITFGNDESVKRQRDYIVMTIMEPLIYNDSIATYTGKVDRAMQMADVPAIEISYLSTLEKSYDIVEEKRALLPEEHPLQLYLIISQLSIAKNWKNLYGKQLQRLNAGGSDNLNGWERDGEARLVVINNKLGSAFKVFAKLLGDEKHPLYLQWKKAHADAAL